MTTFAVFGMTPSRAVELAREEVPHEEEQPDGSKVMLSIPEWELLVHDVAHRTYDSQRTVQLSRFFDTPQIARDFLRLAAQGGGRRLCVRSHHRVGNGLRWSTLA